MELSPRLEGQSSSPSFWFRIVGAAYEAGIDLGIRTPSGFPQMVTLGGETKFTPIPPAAHHKEILPDGTDSGSEHQTPNSVLASILILDATLSHEEGERTLSWRKPKQIILQPPHLQTCRC